MGKKENKKSYASSREFYDFFTCNYLKENELITKISGYYPQEENSNIKIYTRSTFFLFNIFFFPRDREEQEIFLTSIFK